VSGEETARVRVICGACGRTVCQIVDTGRGVMYKLHFGPKGAPLNFDPATVFCPEHGWPDLETSAVAKKLDTARSTGKVTTHRAPCARPRRVAM